VALSTRHFSVEVKESVEILLYSTVCVQCKLYGKLYFYQGFRFQFLYRMIHSHKI